MGFPSSHVLTDEELVSEFICKICFQLAEPASYTICTHVFCTSCLSDWFAKSDNETPVCPSCRTTILAKDVAPLKQGNSLAWRILSRVQCRCPVDNCNWKGDFSEVPSHLTNSETHLNYQYGDQKQTKKLSAEALKDQGNRQFEQRAYRQAITLYSKAISLVPDIAAYYGNRAAAWYMLGAYKESIIDCKAAIGIDPNYHKGYVRMAKALVDIGEFEEAASQLSSIIQKQPDNQELADQYASVVQMQQLLCEGKEAFQEGRYQDSRYAFNDLLQLSDAAAVLLLASRTELALGSADRALRLTLQVIKADSQNTDAYAIRALALLYNADYEQAQKHCKESLRLDPDHAEAGKVFKRVRKVQSFVEAANASVFSRNFGPAVEKFTDAIAMADAPFHSLLSSKLHAERGEAHLRLEDYQACLDDCDLALKGQDDCRDAWLTKTSALHALGRHDDALKTMEDALKVIPPDARVNYWHERAEFEVRKKYRTDYYALLGIGPTSSEMEIKQAYKKLALELHPDKLTEKPDDERVAGEEKFKLMGEALEILTDQFKRQLYDEGHDRERIQEKVAAAQRAAREGNRHGHGHGHGHGHH